MSNAAVLACAAHGAAHNALVELVDLAEVDLDTTLTLITTIERSAKRARRKVQAKILERDERRRRR